MSTFIPLITPYYVSWAEETEKFTEQSPINWLAAVQSIDPTQKNTIQRHRHAGALNYFAWTPGKLENMVSIRAKLNEGRFMLMCFGSEQVTGTDPWTHTLSIARPLPTFTLEFAAMHPTTNFVRRFIGCIVQKLTLALDVNDVLYADIDLIARDVAKYTAKTTVTPNTAKPYHFGQGTLTLNAAAVARLKSYEWTLDNGVEGLEHIGTRKLNAYSEPGADDMVTMELTGEDATFYDLFVADPPTEISGDVNHVRTATSDEFKIKWYNFPLDENKIKPPDDVRGGAYLERLTLPPQYSELVIIDSIAAY